MYTVLVVDDEPTAVRHTCAIIGMKCPGFTVVDTAENGRDALEKVAKHLPDVVISDVKMPLMDGIKLVFALREQYPDILSVIVSGYQDFEYAKGAIQSGVCDYLLKPLAPNDMKAVLDSLATRLDALHYRRRMEILRAMCHGAAPGGQAKAERYFPSAEYFACILRKNGLPKRFTRQTGTEIFSTQEDTALLYGRDEMEALYLYPAEALNGQSFAAAAESLFGAEQSEYYYTTAVVHPQGFAIGGLAPVVNGLYRRLDESVVIGQSRLVYTNAAVPPAGEPTPEEAAQKEHVESLIRYREYGKVLPEVGRLFDLWAAAGHSQLYVEAEMRYLLQMLQKQEEFNSEYGDFNFMVDDSLHYAASMAELKLEYQQLLTLLVPALQTDAPDDPEQLFNTILAYIESHLAEPLTIGLLCARFSISQTTLSRWFRKYRDVSFAKYLTELRIGRAKHILRQNPDTYVKDVAEWVGYADQFYFSRIFHSVVGQSPTEYAREKAARP